MLSVVCALGAAIGLSGVAVQPAAAQSFSISTIEINGNQRIEDATVLSFLNIPRGQPVSAAQLNDAFQRLQRSGLFESVDIVPAGNRLIVTVKEFPTINRVNIEGNKRLKDEDLLPLLQSQSRRVYNPSTAEADAQTLSEGYRQAGRIAATVTPRIIPRSNNRVDLVFEVAEGRVVEVERISFVGNRNYSDRRLRRVVESKQAGLFRTVIASDTFIADRIAFDRQLLRDFYLSRGYVDFQVLSASPELTRERDAFFVTFKVQEGQQFKFGEITTTSDLAEIDIDEFQAVSKIKPGKTYSPARIENTITRMERLAIQKGFDFIRVEPRVTRNDADLTLDIEFIVTRGPRVFVERIDIEGNATTLDRVVRRQFRTVEGDPFNPREIRDAAERIRALNYFSTADVNTREGSGPDQVVVDVDVEETTTGSLGFGVSFGSEAGVGFNVSFSERNFLGRGQRLGFSFDTGSDTQDTSLSFVEPAFLGRDLALGLNVYYRTTDSEFANYDTLNVGFEPSLEFPVSENGRLRLNYRLSRDSIKNVDRTQTAGVFDTSTILQLEEGSRYTSALGYQYSYDTRRTGLNPNAGVLLRFGQQFGGIGGGQQFINTSGLVSAETKVAREEVTLRAEFEFGAQTMLTGNSRITERFFIGGRRLRGFDTDGLGPRDLVSGNRDALGGNYFAVARLEAEFPVGLPEEYGISGGAFFDVGSVWGLDNVNSQTGVVDDSLNLRATIGVSVFWDTQIGPLRFNFSRALKKETYDRERSFDLTVSTRF
ncbi:outer membrane protein assembly factor BamA [uncultured Litoreibacter sp.]|uniref:outer membrane protein assembly factor BamA n=1 Tax=uncultured Litoreibacter sp. TaxID=1392394 RepID=UPI00262FE417|nr:outer membrane protein assembly factor BamA [uncultured Litoreibacter sp.]